MLETIEAFSDIAQRGSAMGWLEMVLTPQELRFWRPLGSDSARMVGGPTALQSVTLMRPQWDKSASLRLKVQANLTRLVHGADGKAWTLHPDEVSVAVLMMLGESQRVLPEAERDPSRWRLSRVDASVTSGFASDDVALAFPAWASAFWSLGSGRRTTSQPGPRSLMHVYTQEVKVRLYDKTAETIANTGKAPAGPHLVRLEEQVNGLSARTAYGESLQGLMDTGAVMAQERLNTWLHKIGPAALAGDFEKIRVRLALGGVTPQRSYVLAGVVLILRSGGVDAIVNSGVSRSVAYKWCAEVRSALGAAYLDDDYGVPFSLDDALFARDMVDA